MSTMEELLKLSESSESIEPTVTLNPIIIDEDDVIPFSDEAVEEVKYDIHSTDLLFTDEIENFISPISNIYIAVEAVSDMIEGNTPEDYSSLREICGYLDATHPDLIIKANEYNNKDFKDLAEEVLEALQSTITDPMSNLLSKLKDVSEDINKRFVDESDINYIKIQLDNLIAVINNAEDCLVLEDGVTVNVNKFPIVDLLEEYEKFGIASDDFKALVKLLDDKIGLGVSTSIDVATYLAALLEEYNKSRTSIETALEKITQDKHSVKDIRELLSLRNELVLVLSTIDKTNALLIEPKSLKTLNQLFVKG